VATASEILRSCAIADIVLQVEGENIVFDGPRQAVTPQLLDDLRRNKTELLAILRSNCDKVTESDVDTFAIDPWESTGAIPANSVTPCPTCSGLEMWEPAAADPLGLSRGKWRCQHCDPPTQSRRIRGLAQQPLNFFGVEP